MSTSHASSTSLPSVPSDTSLPGGTWTLGDLTVTRFGYGAMQLAGPGVMGPPADHDGALAVLREALDADPRPPAPSLAPPPNPFR